MSFPVIFFLIPFVLLVLLAALFVFFNVFHVLRFGIDSAGTRVIVGFYIFGFALLVGISAFLFGRYDWQEKIDPAALFQINYSAPSFFDL